MKDNKNKKLENKELEMKNSSTQSNELNDDDLDNVAGGWACIYPMIPNEPGEVDVSHLINISSLEDKQEPRLRIGEIGGQINLN